MIRLFLLPQENETKFSKMENWRYSQTHNAILGPSGEMLTEDELVYLEEQIQNVSVLRDAVGYELELARLVEELRNILPPPIVHITVNNHHGNAEGRVRLPVWCARIPGIVTKVTLLMSDHTDGFKMPESDLATVFSQNSERRDPSKGRRTAIESEILEFGVSVRSLKTTFENLEDLESGSRLEEPPKGHPEEHLEEPPEETPKNVIESTSLRKERIVVLFLGHWKKSAYAATLKIALKKLSTEPKTSVDATPKKLIEQGSLGHFFKQRSAVSKMIGNWRSMISIVPSRQIRRLTRQQVVYSPEQFLPRLNGAPFDYHDLTLDLFMLGYFHILEQELSPDERKMRHLLCFEVFDHLGRFSWDTVRDFHHAVIRDIQDGKRDWNDGFEDIKVGFFGPSASQAEETDLETRAPPEVRTIVPKVIVQTPTPDEDDVRSRSADFTNLSNEEICRYIDRSFAFWKEKEAEIFHFE